MVKMSEEWGNYSIIDTDIGRYRFDIDMDRYRFDYRQKADIDSAFSNSFKWLY